MASPSDGDLFLSSSPRQSRNNPTDEVLLLAAKAQMVQKLSPAISAFLKKPEQKNLFLEVFTRHVHLLKSRSQAFEDGHVTVYDKALLMLTRNGNNLHSPAAIQYFCEEFLGIDNSGNPEVAERVLEESIILKGVLGQGKSYSFCTSLSLLLTRCSSSVPYGLVRPTVLIFDQNRTIYRKAQPSRDLYHGTQARWTLERL